MSDENKNIKQLNTVPTLSCILFPGIVKNDEKAIQCLGGIKYISQVLSQSEKKINLSFRPENPLLKKISGELCKKPGILLKVKVKKTKIGDEIHREVISTTLLGRVNKVYSFESMSDFQYLPIETDNNGKSQCFVEKLFPSGLDTLDFIKQPCPVYIVPPSFKRMEKAYNYGYTDKKYRDVEVQEADEERNVLMHRKSRCCPVQKYMFGLTNELPTEPQDYMLKKKNQRTEADPQMAAEFEKVQKLFDERPIWSYNLIRYHTKIRLVALKIYLPCLGVYMTCGPWKNLWVKFGYDPRKLPEARKYQTLDFRVRHAGGINRMIKTRLQVLRFKKNDHERLCETQGGYAQDFSENIEESVIYFRPGIVPAQRQTYYQYCDVKIPEVEELLAAEPRAGLLCHQSRGWLPPGADQLCRDYIFKYLKETLLATSSQDLKIEESFSDEESGSNTDDDADVFS